ncbi:Hpt domain-containing protein [Emcibacter sp.]|uniref:Hpt domain-containing protein n=1 Tax=Emcibacter sp. TaxID=1979954 RepID=UPI002AA824F0|nr:Hpt domain-containing protein [Emcibacter sp.]
MTAVNEKSLEQLQFFLEDQFGMVLEKYMADGRGYIVQLREALQQNDLKAMADIAHPFKSTSKQIGADAVASIAEEIELNARRGQELAYGDLIERFPAALDEVEDFLRAYMENTVAG